MGDLCSLTRGWIQVPCIARQIVNHWTTKEGHSKFFYSSCFQVSFLSLATKRTDDRPSFQSLPMTLISAITLIIIVCLPRSREEWCFVCLQRLQYLPQCLEFAQSLCCVWLFAAPWTVACQTPLSIGFPRQEYWSGLPFPSPGDLAYPGINSVSPALARRFFTLSHLGSSMPRMVMSNTHVLNESWVTTHLFHKCSFPPSWNSFLPLTFTPSIVSFTK